MSGIANYVLEPRIRSAKNPMAFFVVVCKVVWVKWLSLAKGIVGVNAFCASSG
jgi:hypothetical protein